jgi:hypothetical protein
MFGSRRRSLPVPTPSWTDERSRDILAYQIIAQRQLEQDSMQWQTPALAITGQAFLLLIAFTPADPLWSRVVAGVLGAFVAAMSMQLMAKHRFLAGIDIHEMKRLEFALGLPPIATRGWAGGRGRANHTLDAPSWGWFRGLKSYWVWIAGMWAFIAANIFAVILTFYPNI